MRACRFLFLLMVGSLPWLPGCRDARPRASHEGHILAGRGSHPSDERLTSEELESRRVLVRDEDLAGLREQLGRMWLGAGLLNQGAAMVDAEEVQRFFPMLGRSEWAAPAGFELDINGFRAQYASLCENPVWSAGFPRIGTSCDPIQLGPVGDFLDDLDIQLALGDIELSWEAPDAAIEGGARPDGTRAPVLQLRAPFGLDPDPDDALGALFDISASRMTVDVRVQLDTCASGACSTDPWAASYRGEGRLGDVRPRAIGIQPEIQSRLVSHNLMVRPVPFVCDLALATGTLFSGSLVAVPAITPAGAIATCNDIAIYVNHQIIESALPPAAEGIGRMLQSMTQSRDLFINISPIGADSLASSVREMCNRPDPRLEANQALPICEALEDPTRTAVVASAFRVIDLANAVITIPSSDGGTTTVTIGERGTSGDGMIRALASEDPLRPVTITSLVVAQNMSMAWATSLCNADPSARECQLISFCESCDTLDRLCQSFCFDEDIPVELPTFDDDDNNREGVRPLAVPSAPDVATLLDFAPNFASELDSIVSLPFARVPHLRVTSTQTCPGDPDCLPGESGALFLFTIDTDEDGMDDLEDTCPGFADDGANRDGDAFGDACDRCPDIASPENTRDVCDCDVDGDGCFNDSEFTECKRTGKSYDERPADRGTTDADSDGILDDCEVDDDGDGVAEDGADDGATYTPCVSGQTTGCDDNCPTTPNGGGESPQHDSDRDGFGNACEAEMDPLCQAASPLCDLAASGFFDRRLTEVAGLRLLSACPPADPGCGRGAWLVRPLCSAERCDEGLELVRVDGAGLSSGSIVIEGLGGYEVKAFSAISLTVIDDIDADGELDLAVGHPFADGHGRVSLVSTKSGAVLETIALGHTGSELGRSVAFRDGMLAIGVPQARDATGASVGAVALFDLADTREPRTVIYGEASGDGFGASVALAGPIDGEALALVVGSPGVDTPDAKGAGAVELRSIAGSRIFRAVGDVSGGALGAQVLAVGGDDALVIASAPLADSERGELHLLDAKGVLRARVRGESFGEGFGTALAGPTDLDGDGALELLASAPGSKGGAGRVALVGLDGQVLVSARGAAGSRAGETLSVVGDLEGDGSLDVAIGLGGASLEDSTQGATLVLSGRR